MSKKVKIDGFVGKNKDFKKKIKGQQEVISLEQKRELTEKVKRLRELGIDDDVLKEMSLEKFNSLYDEFVGLSSYIEGRRAQFIEDVRPVMEKWSFEEVFVYLIDIINTRVLSMVEEYTPEEERVELDDIFPVMYDAIYDSCITRIKEKMEKK